MLKSTTQVNARLAVATMVVYALLFIHQFVEQTTKPTETNVKPNAQTLKWRIVELVTVIITIIAGLEVSGIAVRVMSIAILDTAAAVYQVKLENTACQAAAKLTVTAGQVKNAWSLTALEPVSAKAAHLIQTAQLSNNAKNWDGKLKVVASTRPVIVINNALKELNAISSGLPEFAANKRKPLRRLSF